MLWNLVLEPNKKYATSVKESFCVTMATLDTTTVKNDADIIPVHAKVDSQDVIICNLSKNLCLQVSLSLEFEQGTDVTFYTTGKATVHLTGIQDNEPVSEEEDSDEAPLLIKPRKRKLDDPADYKKKKGKLMNNNGDTESGESSEEDSDILGDLDTDELLSDDELNSIQADDSEDDDDNEEGDLNDSGDDSDDVSDEDEESNGSDVDSSDSDESPVAISSKKTVLIPQSQKQVANKKQQQSTLNGTITKDEKNNHAPKQNVSKTPKKSNNTPKKEKQSDEATNKGIQSGKAAGNKEDHSDKTPKKNDKITQKRTLAGGLEIEDLKVGNGPVAKPNKMVTVYYIGRLKNNNQVIDKCMGGRGFQFRLGSADVIKGWDMGIVDMKVGTKRRLTIPPALAYGSNGSPPTIPKNSTLVFDVELKSVN